jgi:hypothetical protein
MFSDSESSSSTLATIALYSFSDLIMIQISWKKIESWNYFKAHQVNPLKIGLSTFLLENTANYFPIQKV